MQTEGVTIWTLNDGKAGDLVQVEGVAHAVCAELDCRAIKQCLVAPRPWIAWAAPWGPIDPHDRALLVPPYPDILIATGRRAVPAFRALRRRSPGTLAVFLKEPRRPLDADLVWVPWHDRRRGPNVLVTATSPHRITATRLAEARAALRPEIAGLPHPRVAVLLGGATAGVRFGAPDIERLLAGLADLVQSGVSLMITPSRRTPPALLAGIRDRLQGPSVWIWAGAGENPYLELLAAADAFVVTGDSMNMLGEAASTGRPIHVFSPEGLKSKQIRAIAHLQDLGVAVPFAGRLESLAYEPLNATPEIARAIVQLYRERKMRPRRP